jgi:hypothetical protein
MVEKVKYKDLVRGFNFVKKTNCFTVRVYRSMGMTMQEQKLQKHNPHVECFSLAICQFGHVTSVCLCPPALVAGAADPVGRQLGDLGLGGGGSIRLRPWNVPPSRGKRSYI